MLFLFVAQIKAQRYAFIFCPKCSIFFKLRERLFLSHSFIALFFSHTHTFTTLSCYSAAHTYETNGRRNKTQRIHAFTLPSFQLIVKLVNCILFVCIFSYIECLCPKIYRIKLLLPFSFSLFLHKNSFRWPVFRSY